MSDATLPIIHRGFGWLIGTGVLVIFAAAIGG
jgi:hypothetical protein